MDLITDNIVFLVIPVFVSVVAYFLYSKKGRGMMLGGEIVDTATNEISQSSGLLSTKIRAHVIQPKSGAKHVSLEISESAKLGASMKPVKLSTQEAKTLIGMLNEVVSKT